MFKMEENKEIKESEDIDEVRVTFNMPYAVSALIVGFWLLLLLGSIFELVILGIAFFGADKVSCNLLWCTFTTERSSSHSYSSSECYRNGEKINCTLGSTMENGEDIDKIIQEAFKHN